MRLFMFKYLQHQFSQCVCSHSFEDLFSCPSSFLLKRIWDIRFWFWIPVHSYVIYLDLFDWEIHWVGGAHFFITHTCWIGENNVLFIVEDLKLANDDSEGIGCITWEIVILKSYMDSIDVDCDQFEKHWEGFQISVWFRFIHLVCFLGLLGHLFILLLCFHSLSENFHKFWKPTVRPTWYFWSIPMFCDMPLTWSNDQQNFIDFNTYRCRVSQCLIWCLIKHLSYPFECILIH
jgi:hypothetical protein